jgi:ABC-2 type transport system ATP-binding protein
MKYTPSDAVRVQGLRVVRGGREILHTIDVEVAAGTITGLLGPSGSGKTTLLRCLVGVQVIASGTVEVLGTPAGDPTLRRRVGYVTQAPSVYSDLSVRENLKYFAAVLGAQHPGVGAQHPGVGAQHPGVGAPTSDIDTVLAAVGLEHHANDVVNRLSGGEQARVSLATALLGAPELLVLDEPTVGLDPVLRRDLWTLFGQLAANGVTLIISSHVMEEARHCEQLVLLRDGAILARGTPDELRRRAGVDDMDEVFLRLIEGR